MTDPPFGFGLPRDPDEGAGGSGSGQGGGAGGGQGGPGGPFGPLGPLGDPQQFADALRQFADLMSWQGGPVNWDLAKNLARQTVAAKGDPSVLDIERTKITEALRLADLWLEDATSFPTGIRTAAAWSRSEWVEATLPVWSKLCDPIAERAVEAMGGLLTEDPTEMAEDLPPEMRTAMMAMTGGLGALGGLGDMMRRIGGMMVGGQIGAAIGALADEVVSSTDVGLPLGPEGTAALLPAGVAAFGSGLAVTEEEIRLFLAMREAAHHRLFAHVPWLRSRLLGAVEDYARGIKVDAAALRDAMPQIDPSNPGGAERGALRRCPVPARGHAAAEGGPGPAGDRAGPGGGLGSDGRPVRGPGPAAAGDRAGRGYPAPPRDRRPGRADIRDTGRAGTAAAAAARGGGHLAGPDR